MTLGLDKSTQRFGTTLALGAVLWAGRAAATCCGGGEGFLEARTRHGVLALEVQGVSVALGVLGLGLSLWQRRRWLSLAWVGLLGAGPGLAVMSADDCASVAPSMHSLQLAALMMLGPQLHSKGRPWSFRSQALLLVASTAAALADWSLTGFEWSWSSQGWLLLPIPAWVGWRTFWSWLLARPLSRGARSWAGLDLVERRVLVVGALGAVPLGACALMVSAVTVFHGWQSLLWATELAQVLLVEGGLR